MVLDRLFEIIIFEYEKNWKWGHPLMTSQYFEMLYTPITQKRGIHVNTVGAFNLGQQKSDNNNRMITFTWGFICCLSRMGHSKYMITI